MGDGTAVMRFLPHFIYAIGETKVRACTKNLGDCRDNEKKLAERVLSHLLDRRAKLAQRIYRVYSDLIAQRIFVDRARPFWAHSCADGRITSLE